MIHTKLFPWYIAQARKAYVTQITLGLTWWTGYWDAWTKVMFPESKG